MTEVSNEATVVETPPAGTETPSAPSATQTPPAATTATNQEEETVTIPKSAYTKLQSQRDSNHEALRQLQGATAGVIQRETIRDTLAKPDFKEKYPDVTAEDLLEADAFTEEEITEVATRRQQSYARVRQDAIAKANIGDDLPELTPEQADSELQTLKSKRPRNMFQRALQIRRQEARS